MWRGLLLLPPRQRFTAILLCSRSTDDEQTMFVELQESFDDHNPTQRRSLESLKFAESELADIASMTRSENVSDLFSDEPALNPESNQ